MLHGQFPSRMAKIHHERFPDNARPEITRPSVSWTLLGLDHPCIRSIIISLKKKLAPSDLWIQKGNLVSVHVDTIYPFSDTLTTTITASSAFQYYVRIPGWVVGGTISINRGSEKAVQPSGNGLLAISVSAGTTQIVLNLPANIVTGAYVWGEGGGEAVRTPLSEMRFLGKKTDRMARLLYIAVLSILHLTVSFFLICVIKVPFIHSIFFSFHKFQEVKKSSPKTHNNLSPLTSNSTQRVNGNTPSIPRRCKSIFPIRLRLFRVPSLIPVNCLWVSVSRLVLFSGWRLVVRLRRLHRRIRRVQAPIRRCLLLLLV